MLITDNFSTKQVIDIIFRGANNWKKCNADIKESEFQN